MGSNTKSHDHLGLGNVKRTDMDNMGTGERMSPFRLQIGIPSKFYWRQKKITAHSHPPGLNPLPFSQHQVLLPGGISYCSLFPTFQPIWFQAFYLLVASWDSCHTLARSINRDTQGWELERCTKVPGGGIQPRHWKELYPPRRRVFFLIHLHKGGAFLQSAQKYSVY